MDVPFFNLYLFKFWKVDIQNVFVLAKTNSVASNNFNFNKDLKNNWVIVIKIKCYRVHSKLLNAHGQFKLKICFNLFLAALSKFALSKVGKIE